MPFDIVCRTALTLGERHSCARGNTLVGLDADTEGKRPMVRMRVIQAIWILAAVAIAPLTALAAQGHIEFFAPARLAESAITAARQAGAAELAPDELRLADRYIDEATAALEPSSGPSDIGKATRLFRLATAEARLAETRAVEIVTDRKAAEAAARFQGTLEGSGAGLRMGPSGTPEAMSEYARLRRQAAKARSARRAAEEDIRQLGNEGS